MKHVIGRVATVACMKHGRECVAGDDCVAVEEPLEILIDGRPVAVVMRTPGDDVDLVTGFLLSEGIVTCAADISEVSLDFGDNRAVAFLADGVVFDAESLSRHVFSASSCGICGKASIDAVMRDLPQRDALQTGVEMLEDALFSGFAAMERNQPTFDATGGIHAAALVDCEGNLLTLREDVGRHNAVDKVIGDITASAGSLTDCVLIVSGRLSFEIVQKSIQVGLLGIAGVSAPSSLAVSLAAESGLTLVGFLRPPRWNLYHEGVLRIRPHA